ncbi:MAG: aminoacyl-tRNA deacylase [Deltaproteobacteria bacterium]|jgi:Cys-tRNA(Pro)/Cys-tRNA(Cys) deacylase|nr:aminoacyl-tRNA deacylase [Deltaproteobacteria bacterium]MBW2529892.1 aminoacyl-tRNA deacylase [Deltaproteobacteria bacterium]
MASFGQQALTERGVSFESHEYDYRKKGARVAAASLGLDPAAMLKTLVVRLSDGRHLFLLAPGDKEVSMRSLARALDVKSAELASERDAHRLTGYQVGGIGPFGSRTPLPVVVDLSAADHERVYVNGGRRGLILGLTLDDLMTAADAELVDVGIST